MTKKDLEGFLAISTEIKQLEDEIKILKEQKTSIKSQIITDLPKGGTAKLLEDIIIRIEESIHDLAKKRVNLAEQVLLIEENIEELQPHERALIRYKYINDMSYHQIEKRMNYSVRHLKRIHSQILEKIA